MPSFDIVSEVNQVEVRNAVDQTNKEVSTRFDFGLYRSRASSHCPPLPLSDATTRPIDNRLRRRTVSRKVGVLRSGCPLHARPERGEKEEHGTPVSGNDWLRAPRMTASDQHRHRTSAINGSAVGLLMAEAV